MNNTEVQNPWRKLFAYHNWFRWLTVLSVALMLALCTLSCCCLYSLLKCFRSSHACMPYVFTSVLACAKPARACVSEVLLPALQTLSLSFLTNSSTDSKAFQHFIAFSGSPTAVHCAFLFFNAKAWPQSQTDLSCALRYYTHSKNTWQPHFRLSELHQCDQGMHATK